MPWGRLDDSLYDHPKLDALGKRRLEGIGLWAVAISWSNRRLTDGLVPAGRIGMLGGNLGLADALVRAGLFDEAEGGYAIHDFLTFNDSKVEVEARRAEAARRQREKRARSQRESHGESQRDAGNSHGGSQGTPSRPSPVPSIPGPSNVTSGPSAHERAVAAETYKRAVDRYSWTRQWDEELHGEPPPWDSAWDAHFKEVRLKPLALPD